MVAVINMINVIDLTECDQPMATKDMGPVDKPEGVIAEDIKRVKRGEMGKRQYISPESKMAVLDYVSVHGLRPAARLFRIAPSTIRGWREQDLEAPHRPNGRITCQRRDLKKTDVPETSLGQAIHSEDDDEGIFMKNYKDCYPLGSL